MKCDLVKIGTSKCIRIPAIILKELGNPDSFNVEFDETKLVLIPQTSIKSRLA